MIRSSQFLPATHARLAEDSKRASVPTFQQVHLDHSRLMPGSLFHQVAPDHFRSGEESSPSQVCCLGIVERSLKAELSIFMFAPLLAIADGIPRGGTKHWMMVDEYRIEATATMPAMKNKAAGHLGFPGIENKFESREHRCQTGLSRLPRLILGRVGVVRAVESNIQLEGRSGSRSRWPYCRARISPPSTSCTRVPVRDRQTRSNTIAGSASRCLQELQPERNVSSWNKRRK